VLGSRPGATFTGPEGAILFFFFFGAPNRDETLRAAVHLLSEGGDPNAGYVGDLLQATAATSNHMPHKIFGDDQRGREAVGGELPRVMSREESRDRFTGSRQRGGSRAPSGATPLGSDMGDSHTLGSLNFG